MSREDLHNCCWCSTSTFSEEIKSEDRWLDHDDSIKLLLELLGLSPTMLVENVIYRLCSGCTELVSTGTERKVQVNSARTNFIKKILLDQLEEVKTKLKARTRNAFTAYTAAKKKSRKTLGISLSSCFTECVVKLGPEDLISFDDFQKHLATGSISSETPSKAQEVTLCSAEIKHEGYDDILQEEAVVDWSKFQVDKGNYSDGVSAKPEQASLASQPNLPLLVNIGNVLDDSNSLFRSSIQTPGVPRNIIDSPQPRDLKFKVQHTPTSLELDFSLDSTQGSDNVPAESKLPKRNNAGVEGMYECAGCSEIFTTLQAKNDHETSHLLHSQGRGCYVCGFCEVEFADLLDLRRHKQVHQQRTFVCHFCGKIFGDQDALLEHVNNHSALRFLCDICNKKFPTTWKLISLQNNGKTRYVCKPCNKSCTQKRYRIRHIQMNSRDSTAVQQEALTDDSLDPLKTVSVSSLSGTEELRTGASAIVTPAYEYVSVDEIINRHSVQETRAELFGTLNSLNEKLDHERSHITAPEDQQYEFEKTRKANSVSLGPSLKMTSSIHCPNLRVQDDDGALSFKCTICNKKFRVLVALRSHEISHSENRPFACSDCKMTFKSLANLTNHRKRHFGCNGIKRYECSACGKCYTRSHSLKLHVRAHPECARRMTTKENIFTLV